MSAQKIVRFWSCRHLVLGAAAWLLSTIPTTQAMAAGSNQDAVAQVVRLNKEARTFYDAMEFDMAEKNLKKAIEIGEAAALGDHVVMVGTYGNLGVLYATGLKNETEAVAHFKKALELRPDYLPSKELSSPEVKDLFQRAKADLESSPPSSVPDVKEPADTGASSEKLSCPVADTATTGMPLKLRCVAESGLGAKDVVVYYHAGTNSKFRSLKMTVESTMDGTPSWTAALAPDALSDEQLFIYFEARDRKSKVLASVNSASKPIVVGIRAAPPSLPRSSDDDEAKHGSSDSGPLWFGMGIGTGYGYAASAPESYKPYIPDFKHGAAPAKLFHLTPEVGYFLSPNWSVSLQGRLQEMQQWSPKTAKGAIAFLGRLLYFTGGETFRFYGGAVLGGGEGFRLVVSNVETKGYKNDGYKVTTTVKGGPVIAGATVGMAINISDSWSWIIESNALLGFPTFSMVADFNTGIRFSL